MVRNDNEKRSQIAAAAYRVLEEKGYDKASTKEIAREAGVAQGLINYYFPSKDDLFIEVIRVETRLYCESFEQIHTTDPLEEKFQKGSEILMNIVTNRPACYRLRFELFALGIRNPALKKEVQECLEEGRNKILELLSKVSDHSNPKLYSLASIILANIDGLALQKIVDPAFDIESAFTELAKMVKSALSEKEK